MVKVSFESQGVKLVGNLRLPSEPASGRPSAVLVTGSWMTVKEQMPERYAELLARAGYASLTFDFRGFGVSDGAPREVESARMKALDIRAAVHFLQRRADVDPARIGSLCICASAGYTVLAAQDEPGLKSIAMVAPWLHNRPIVEAFYGGPEGVAERKRRARAARERFETTGEVEYVTAASNTDPTAAMYWEGDALDYYLNPKRGNIPQWGNRFAVMAWTEWLNWDPIALAPRHSTPTRLVTGKQTATPGGVEQFADAMAGPHDVSWLEGTQFHFYDDPATVSSATASAIEHFRRTL